MINCFMCVCVCVCVWLVFTQQNGLQALQSILEWGWDQSLREPRDELMKMVVKNSLGILSSHIKEVYPAKG